MHMEIVNAGLNTIEAIAPCPVSGLFVFFCKRTFPVFWPIFQLRIIT